MRVRTTGSDGTMYVSGTLNTERLRANWMGIHPKGVYEDEASAAHSMVSLHAHGPVVHESSYLMDDRECQVTRMRVGADTVTWFTEPGHLESLIAAFEGAAEALRRLR
jgi:hypothetical protein